MLDYWRSHNQKMESKTKFILVLSLFVGLALATEKPDPETMFTTSDEEYEMENHDLSKLDDRRFDYSWMPKTFL